MITPSESYLERLVITMLAAVIGAHILVGLVGVFACLWYMSECKNLNLQLLFNDPLHVLLGLLGGRVLGPPR